MANTIKIKNITTGKIYNLPYMIVNGNYDIYDNMDANFYEGELKIISGSLTSIYEFLEIPQGAGYACILEINGQQIHCVTMKSNIDQHHDILSMTYKGKDYRIRSKLEVMSDNIWDSSFLVFLGSSLVYNIANKKFYDSGSVTRLTPSRNGSYNAQGTRYYYEGNMPSNSIIKQSDLKENVTVNAVWNLGGGITPYNWTSTQMFSSSEGLGGLLNELNIKPPSYPDQDPDDEDGDDGQPTPDPPISGDGDTSSDPIPDPPPQPAWDVSDTGFVVIYNPTVQEIRQLAYFMWSGDFADLIKKVFAEPFDAIISLKMLFCPVTAGASQTVWLGNVETTVSMSKVTKQFTDIDLGSVNITEFFGSFADYAPFTKIQIFLPFIGYKDLNTDEVMNSSLHLRYRVDVYSGACIAFLTVTKNIKSTQLNSILYQFDGNCAMEIPFTSNDNSRYISAILNSAASSALSLANTSAFTSAQPPFMFDKGEKAKFTLGSLAPVANGMLDIMSTKPNVQRAGSLAGAVSAMGVKQPYIIIHRPIQHMPANYNHFIGIPLNLSRQLSTIKGYTIISQVFISSQTATDDEITMITELLKSGVIL